MSVTAPEFGELATEFPRSLPARVAGGLWRFARRSPLSAFWGVIALLIVVVALAAPDIAPYAPLRSDFRHMTKPPDALHWFGTDQIGRDTLSRVIYGSRTSLLVAFGAVLLGTTLGAVWGLASGFFGINNLQSDGILGLAAIISDRLMEGEVLKLLGGKVDNRLSVDILRINPIDLVHPSTLFLNAEPRQVFRAPNSIVVTGSLLD